jgi:glycosyltransferase involved in cell wall biosynthesis
MRSKKFVSIIIPTFNSEKTIHSCLKSIIEQTYKEIEIIIVDKYSQDNTIKIAEEYGAKILVRNVGRSAARNLGAKYAGGDFLLFIDSDMELTPKVIEECVATSTSNNIDAVIIPEETITKGFLSECRRLEKQLYAGNKLFEIPRFFKKSVFQKLGGYDEKLVFGEDFDLYIRLERMGFKTDRISPKIMHHEEELSMERIILKAYNYGKSLPAIIMKNPHLLLKRHNPLSIILNLKTLFKSPLHAAGLLTIKIIEYLAYLIGLLIRVLGRLLKSSHINE